MDESNNPSNTASKPGDTSGSATPPAAAASAAPSSAPTPAAVAVAPSASAATTSTSKHNNNNISAAVAAAAAIASGGNKPPPLSVGIGGGSGFVPAKAPANKSSNTASKPKPPSSSTLAATPKDASTKAKLSSTSSSGSSAFQQQKPPSKKISTKLLVPPKTAAAAASSDSDKWKATTSSNSAAKLANSVRDAVKKNTTNTKEGGAPVKPPKSTKPKSASKKAMIPKAKIDSSDDTLNPNPLPASIYQKKGMVTVSPSSKPAATATPSAVPSSSTAAAGSATTAAAASSGDTAAAATVKSKGDKLEKKKIKKMTLLAKKKKKKKSTNSSSSVEGPTMAEVLKKKGKKKKDKTPKDKSAATASNPSTANTNNARKLPTASNKKKTSSSQQSNNPSANNNNKPTSSISTAFGAGPQPNAPPSSSGYSAQQTAVNDMMRRALEEDQYSALGSVVDTETSDEDDDGDEDDGEDEAVRWNHRPSRRSSGGNGSDSATNDNDNDNDNGNDNGGNKPWTGTTKLDRQSIMTAMRKHLRIEGMKSVRNFDGGAFLEDAEDYVERGGGGRSNSVSAINGNGKRSLSPLRGSNGGGEEGHVGGATEGEILAVDGRRIGKRRKKKKKGKNSATAAGVDAAGGAFGVDSGTSSGADTPMSGSGNEDEWEDNAVAESSAGVDEEGDTEYNNVGEEEESSIFGQTAGASNATWVECDRCKKWRRLRGVVDARKLPSRWYCSMNKTDPDRARCSAPEEEYESATTPESAMDQRTRKHLRVWVRRLHCNEAFENRQRSSKKRAAAGSNMSAKEPYEWVRCCNPSCGKWRMLLRSMDAGSVIDKCKRGEWYCVMNTWDEKAASCGAAQENLPAVGCPPWVLVDNNTED